MAIPNLYQSVWEKLLEKIENSHFWPFQIYISLFGKKFGMAIFGHSKFIPVCLGKIVQKNLEQPFLAIPNLYQSVWEKLFKKIWNSHFWPFQIYSSLFGKNCWKKLRTAIFGHSKFIPVLLGKIVGKNSEQPFLAIPNLYQSVWEKLLEKNQSSHFWPFQIYTSLFGKNCSKKFGRAIFGHSKLIVVCLGKIVGKRFRTAIFGHSKFIPVSLGKLLEKIQNSHFWPIQICSSLFRKNCWKNLEWPFLAILNLYQYFWEKLLEKNQNSHFWPFQIYTSRFGKNCQQKFGRAIFDHSKFIAVFLGTLLEKIEDSHFWPFQICTSLGKIVGKKLRTAIFGHSKFIPIFLGKIVGIN